MKLPNVSTLAGLSLLAACASKSGAGSQDPDAANYDGYYSETPGEGGADGSGSAGHRPQARASTSTRHIDRPVGKHISLVAKRPPVDGGEKPRTPHDPPATSEPLVLDGYLPTAAGPGSVLELFGAGLDRSGLGVMVGGKRAKVVEAAADRLLVEVPTGGKAGPILLTSNVPIKGVKGVRGTALPQLRTQTSFTPLAADAGFGKPRTNPAHGLIGNVYDLGGEVTEIPSFGDLGDPVAVVAVDNLSIPSYEFNGSIGGLKEWFGIHFRGSLNITESGEYELCLSSGDGAHLYLDEQLVVNNDGVHATTEACEPVFAEPGEYQVDLLYFQAAAGELGLTLSWSKDGGAKEPIPALHLFPPEDADSMAMR